MVLTLFYEQFKFEIMHLCVEISKLFKKSLSIHHFVALSLMRLLISELESKHEFVIKVRDLVRTWPRTIFIVMRYIFAFLNHLSEYRYLKPSLRVQVPQPPQRVQVPQPPLKSTCTSSLVHASQPGSTNLAQQGSAGSSC